MGNITGAAHVGICVTDLERSVDFYCTKLGFELFERCRLDDATGKADIAFVRLGKLSLELMCWEGAERRTDGPVDHLALKVNDIEAVHDALLAKGIVFDTPQVCSNMSLFENGTKWIIFHGPDGEHLELAEVF